MNQSLAVRPFRRRGLTRCRENTPRLFNSTEAPPPGALHADAPIDSVPSDAPHPWKDTPVCASGAPAPLSFAQASLASLSPVHHAKFGPLPAPLMPLLSTPRAGEPADRPPQTPLTRAKMSFGTSRNGSHLHIRRRIGSKRTRSIDAVVVGPAYTILARNARASVVRCFSRRPGMRSGMLG